MALSARTRRFIGFHRDGGFCAQGSCSGLGARGFRGEGLGLGISKILHTRTPQGPFNRGLMALNSVFGVYQRVVGGSRRKSTNHKLEVAHRLGRKDMSGQLHSLGVQGILHIFPRPSSPAAPLDSAL